MHYVILGIALVTAYHAFTFAKWLRQQGNTTGAIGVAVIIAVSIALPIYLLASS